MVCKKCGNKLTDGIDICPYCGEGSNQENVKTSEINSFINDLNNLKIDVENEKEYIEKDKKEVNLEKILEITQDLSNLKYEIEGIEEKSDEKIENTKKIVENLGNLKIDLDESKSNENINPFILNEVEIKPQPIESEIKDLTNDNSFEKIEIPIVESIIIPEVSDISDDISNISEKDDNENNIENIQDETASKETLNINLEEIKTLPEEKISIQSFENDDNDISDSLIADSDSIKIVPDLDLSFENNSEEIKKDNYPQTNINELINDLKGIELEKTNFDNMLDTNENQNEENLKKIKEEEEKRLNIYDLVNELKSVNVEGIKSVSNPLEIPPVPMIEELEIKPENKFENAYLFKADEKNDNNSSDSTLQEITLPSVDMELANNQLDESETINVEPLETNLQETELSDSNLDNDDESESGDIPEMNLPPFPEIPEVPEISDDLTDSIESEEKTSKQEVFINDNLIETNESIENNEKLDETKVTEKKEKSSNVFLIVFIIVAVIGIALAIYLAYLLAQQNLS